MRWLPKIRRRCSRLRRQTDGAGCRRRVALRRSAGATPMIVGQARRFWAAEFRAAGINSPELDARILVGHALARSRRPGGRGRAADSAPAKQSRSQPRAPPTAREPIARIVGSKEFWGLELRVDAATLVPRPETETVVEAALAAVDPGPRSRPLRIADLGTGSGAILLALLTELPTAFGVGTDVSPAALAVARDNARRLGLTRAAFVACDLAAALRGPFDLIVSNPPYVASGDIAALAAGGAAVRSASRARRRRRRSRFLSGDCRGGARAAGAGRRARRRAWRRPGGIGRPLYLPRQGLRPRRRDPILMECRALSLQESYK